MRGRGRRVRCRWRLAAAAALLAGGGAAGAQPPAPDGPRLEGRLDARFADGTAVEVGGGVAVRAGLYVRLAALAGAGFTWRDGERRPGGRVDLVARFLVDPLRESRWAPYAGGGVGARFGAARGEHVLLIGLVGLEGPAVAGRLTAFELGLGGGIRVGVAVRRAPPRGR